MKNKYVQGILMALLSLLCIAAFLIGLIVAFFGFEYFMFKEPKREYWLAEISTIRLGMFAWCLWIAGMVSAILPIGLLMMKLREMYFEKKPAE